MDNESQRPLIDVAREWVETYSRKEVAQNYLLSRGYVMGYDDGRESVAAEKNAGFVDTLTLANQRIAELEAFIAAQDAHDHYAERDDVKSLREKVAELEARNKWLSDEVTKMHKLYGDLAASRAALGVVVDDAMVERFCRQFFANNGFWSGAHWMPSDKTRDDARNAMYAALTSATIVPLASAEPVGVCSRSGSLFSTEKIGKAGWSDCHLIYKGATAQAVRDGE
jgi:hypothetical protein